MNLIKLENVSKFYKSEDTVSVGMKHVSLTFRLGEFIAVTGESGSGKSTLLNVISGLDGYENGELYLFEEETSHFTISDWEKYRGTYVGFVFQSYNIIDSYTVLQNVLLALEVQNYDPKKRKQRALELIEKVGLTSHKNHKASKLSGGQKQRTVIARALAKDCPIIVADEPTGNLDSESAKTVMELLYEISKDKLVVVVTHDYSQVESYATRKIKMHDGEVVEDRKLKKVGDVSLENRPIIKGMKLTSLFRFAVRNLLSTPRKLIFMLLLQILVIGAFTLVYTDQISSVRESGLEQSVVFPSVPNTRLLIERRDGLPFRSQEIERFNKQRYVRYVHEYGVNFYNQSNLVIEQNSGFGQGFLQGTDTAEMLSLRDVDGRLPVEVDEIVVSSHYGNFRIGDVVNLSTQGFRFFADLKNEINDSNIGTFTIVGIDKLDRNILYFSRAYLDQPDIVSDFVDQSLKNQLIDTIGWSMQVTIDDQSYYAYRAYEEQNYDLFQREGEGLPITIDNQTVTFTSKSTYGKSLETTRDVSISMYSYDEEYDWMSFSISPAIFDDIVNEFMVGLENEYTVLRRNIVSLSVDGFFSGNQVIRSIDLEHYIIYYPSNISTPLRDFTIFMFGLIALVFLTLFGMFLYSIVHAVSKNMMNARKKDFAIFRSIGANQATLAKLVVLEQVLLSIFGFVITILILNVLRNNVTFIRTSLFYMERQDYFILFSAFVFFGVWLGLRFNKRVFKQTVIETLTASRED
jgi:putative ABC transport system permease protein